MIENFVEYDFHDKKSDALLFIVYKFFEILLFILNTLIFYLNFKWEKPKGIIIVNIYKIIKLLISNLK